jgi:hypothetical protein
MGPPKTPAPDVRIECESAIAPPEIAEEGQPPNVVGVPSRALLGREMKRREIENLFAALHLEEPRCMYVLPLPTNEILMWCMAL